MTTNLIQLGDFVLNSGAESKWKLECDRFIEENAEGLAYLIRLLVGPFGSVEGVPRGGLRLAYELARWRSPAGPHLIVDDVLTTGGSMERARNSYAENHPGEVAPIVKHTQVIGAVVFARGRCPAWITPLLQLPEPLWVTK